MCVRIDAMTERINITVPSALLAAIDEAAAGEHLTRSGFLRAAALDRLGAASGARAGDTAPVAAGEAREDSVAYAAPHQAAHMFGPDMRRAWPPSPDTAAALLTAFFAAREDVEVAYLFGSVARGEAHAGSDLDVAVLLGEGTVRDREWDVHAQLLSRIGSLFATDDVDVVVLNSAPMAIALSIVEEGVVVAGARRPLRSRYEAAVVAHATDVKTQAAAQFASLRDRIYGGRFVAE